MREAGSVCVCHKAKTQPHGESCTCSVSSSSRIIILFLPLINGKLFYVQVVETSSELYDIQRGDDGFGFFFPIFNWSCKSSMCQEFLSVFQRTMFLECVPGTLDLMCLCLFLYSGHSNICHFASGL